MDPVNSAEHLDSRIQAEIKIRNTRSMDPTEHLNSAMRMGLASMNPVHSAEQIGSASMEMEPAELDQMIVEETY